MRLRSMIGAALVVAMMTASVATPVGAAAPSASTAPAAALSSVTLEATTPVLPTPPDAWDASDAATSGATTLAEGARLERLLAFDASDPGARDLDLFAVDLVAGVTYRITAEATWDEWGPADPMLDVWSPSQVTSETSADPADWAASLIAVDAARLDTATAEIVITPRETGRHIVAVQDGFDASGGGGYAVSLRSMGVCAGGDLRRVTGLDRYEVAAQLAQLASGGVEPMTIIIASGQDAAAADPLAAGSLAGLYDAPILLVRSGAVPEPTLAYLRALSRTHPVRFYIAGGPASVPERLKATILTAAPRGSVFVGRFSGADRYAVSAAIAAHVRSRTATSAVCFVVNGSAPAYFFDALAASTMAARMRYPVLLTKSSFVPPPVGPEVARYRERIIVGNTSAVGVAVATTLRATGRVGYETEYDPLYDRQRMARLVAEYATQRGWLRSDRIAVANALPDALVGGAAIGRLGGTVLFTDGADAMDAEATEGWLVAARGAAAPGGPALPSVWIVGGPASVDETIAARIRFLAAVE